MINSSGLPSSVGQLQVLSQEQLLKLEHFFYFFLWPVLISFGVVNNILNIVVFIKVGARDSVTFSFLLLSMSDLMMLLSSGVMGASAVYGRITTGQRVKVSGFSLAGYLAWYQMMFAEISMGITTYIAVTRCCCVAMALHFKEIFTLRRSIVILSTITISCILTRIPVLRTNGLSWQWSRMYNMTRLTLWFCDEYFVAFDVLSVLNKTVYPNVVLVIVTTCSVILSRALVQASRVRSSMVSSKNAISHSHTKSSSGRNSFATAAVTAEISMSEVQNNVNDDKLDGNVNETTNKPGDETHRTVNIQKNTNVHGRKRNNTFDPHLEEVKMILHLKKLSPGKTSNKVKEFRGRQIAKKSIELARYDKEEQKLASYSRKSLQKSGPVKPVSHREDKSDVKTGVKSNNGKSGKLSKSAEQNLSDKEIGMVQAVTLITIFLSVTVFFLSLRAIAELAIPGFSNQETYPKLKTVTILVESTFLYINADVNFLVYIKFNSKFRCTLRTLVLKGSS